MSPSIIFAFEPLLFKERRRPRWKDVKLTGSYCPFLPQVGKFPILVFLEIIPLPRLHVILCLYFSLLLPCEQLISPTPNERETSVSNRQLFHRAGVSFSRPTWCIWRQLHLFTRGVCTTLVKRTQMYQQKLRPKNAPELRRSTISSGV